MGNLLSKNVSIKVRSSSGITVDDMFYNMPILKRPDYLIDHVGTNNATNYKLTNILDKLFKLNNFAVYEQQVYLSKPIITADSTKAASFLPSSRGQLLKGEPHSNYTFLISP